MRRSLQLSLFAVVLLGLIGGTLAFFVAQKSVTLTVDGQVRHVGTYADTVGEVLDDEGLEPAAHDVVLPAAGDAVRDGDTVILNRARPLELTVDGVSRQVYVTALSVDEALGQLGFRADGLVLSASRSERLPLDGMELTITTPKEIVLVADGQQRVVTTTAATAGDLLAEQGIALSETDRTSLYLDQGAAEPHAAAGLPGAGLRDLPDDRRAVRTSGWRPRTPTRSWASETVTTPGVDGEQVHDVPRHRRRRRRDRPRGRSTHERHRRAGHRAGDRRHQAASGCARGHRRRRAGTSSRKCEAGGNWAINTGNGYYGGLQFNASTWARLRRHRVRPAGRPGHP